MENLRENTAYTCPMHPKVTSDRPGMCPECGMSLVKIEKLKKKVRSAEHDHSKMDKHAGHKRDDFLVKFYVALVLSIPIIAYSEITEILFAWRAPEFPGSAYLPLVLGSVVFWYAGLIFLTSAFREIKARAPGMMTLIALAISVAYFYSVYAVFAGGETLFWELATLIAIMLLGHYVEMKSVQGAKSALRELSKLLPDTAELVEAGGTKTIPLSELREGEVVFIRPGTRVPADSVVIEGSSDVDESIVTGESRPVRKNVGAEVVAGTMNGDGALKARVAKIGERTFLAGVMRLVSEAEASKSKVQLLADKAAFYLTIVAVSTGIITFVAWLMKAAGIAFATERTVAVLVIACPHALGLAIPLVASISTTKAAMSGFLVRKRIALEAARNIDIVLFDKTGTLTEGSYGVTRIFVASGVSEGTVLGYAAAIDLHSEHFIAKAIVRSAKEKGVNIPVAQGFRRISGKGGSALIGGENYYVGGEAILDEARVKVPAEIEGEIRKESVAGKTVIYTAKKNSFLGAFALSDIIRPESRAAIAALRKLGVKSAMVTGDTEDVAKWVAAGVGLDEYFARVLPGEKAEKVKSLQARGLRVAMVGDGVNDAPALTQADLGVAIGAGTNVAIESAGIVLVRNDPRDIARIIGLSKMTYAKMVQNLFWATGYNVVTIPLAAGALAGYGVMLEPALAAVLMSVSTVVVAINAVLLKRKKL